VIAAVTISEAPREPVAIHSAERQAFWARAILGARDQPDAKHREDEPGRWKHPRESFRQYAKRGWDGCPEDGRNRRRDPHIALCQRPVEQSQAHSAGSARRHGPEKMGERWKNLVLGQSQGRHHDGPAKMPEAGEEEGVEALGGVASYKIADTPTADRSEGEEGGRELGGKRHG
jgi:hypothetical protein